MDNNFFTEDAIFHRIQSHLANLLKPTRSKPKVTKISRSSSPQQSQVQRKKYQPFLNIRAQNDKDHSSSSFVIRKVDNSPSQTMKVNVQSSAVDSVTESKQVCRTGTIKESQQNQNEPRISSQDHFTSRQYSPKSEQRFANQQGRANPVRRVRLVDTFLNQNRKQDPHVINIQFSLSPKDKNVQSPYEQKLRVNNFLQYKKSFFREKVNTVAYSRSNSNLTLSQQIPELNVKERSFKFSKTYKKRSCRKVLDNCQRIVVL